MKILRNLYNWVLSWGEHRHARSALATISFAESSFFPIPPDPLLLAMGMGKPRRSLSYAAICTLASVAGGLFGYYLGFAGQDFITSLIQVIVDPLSGAGAFLGTPEAGPAIVASSGEALHFGSHAVYADALLWKVMQLYQGNAFMAVLGAALTPIPYKVFTIAGGYSQISLVSFVAASVIGRGARFFAVALVIRVCGERAKDLIDKYFSWVVSLFFLLLVGGFAAIKWVLA